MLCSFSSSRLVAETLGIPAVKLDRLRLEFSSLLGDDSGFGGRVPWCGVRNLNPHGSRILSYDCTFALHLGTSADISRTLSVLLVRAGFRWFKT